MRQSPELDKMLIHASSLYNALGERRKDPSIEALEMSRYQTQEYDWEVPPLDAQDQRLVDAYSEVGRSLDDLPYTGDFDRLCEILGVSNNNEDRHRIYKRLLTLRKSGHLPRVSRPSSMSSSSLGLDEP